MPQIQIIAPTAQQQPERLRVAAYARVSSDSKDQLNSYASQIRYYTNYITAHENWDFVDIYADEGITGTRADKRDDFQRMMRDCRAHKIDTILVKSVSRFARNTQDCIAAVRELRSLGVTVIFEKEHLNTSTMANEMLLSMMSAFSQEESVSISKNMHKGATMRMQNGTYKLSKAPYGYSLDEKGNLIVCPEEAEVVRSIFKDFLSGCGINRIRKRLIGEGVSKGSSKVQWTEFGIQYILSNERYMGDELFQKRYSANVFPFTQRLNRGELPQYYAEDTHEAIISKEVFQQTQALLEKKSLQYARPASAEASVFRGVLYCSNCGKPLYRKVRPAGIEWACPVHRQNSECCKLQNIPERAIRRILFHVYSKLIRNDCEILRTYRSELVMMKEKSALPEKLSLNQKLSELLEQHHTLNRLHAKGCLDPAFYISQSQEQQKQIDLLRSSIKSIRTDFDSLINSTDEVIYTLEKLSSHIDADKILPLIVQITFTQDFCEINLHNSMKLREPIYGGRYG